MLSETLDVVVGISSSTKAEAEQDAEANYEEETQEDVDRGGAPEGKQVERLVTVKIHTCAVLVVVGLVNRVDPHVSSNEPAEKEERGQRVPGHADSVEGVGGVIFGLLSAGQAGEHGEHHTKHPGNYQIDRDVALPWAVVQVQ